MQVLYVRPEWCVTAVLGMVFICVVAKCVTIYCAIYPPNKAIF
jgi:hypothetical protein